MPLHHHIASIVVLASCAIAAPARAQGGGAESEDELVFRESCQRVAPRETIEAFHAAISQDADLDCTLLSVKTRFWKTRIRWWTGEEMLAPVLLAPAGCLVRSTVKGEHLSLAADAEFQRRCPAAFERMKAQVESGEFSRVFTVKTRGKTAQRSRVLQTEEEIALHLARWALLLCLALLVLHAIRAMLGRNHRVDRTWLALAAIGFAVAAAVRLGLEPRLANWYAEVLPLRGSFYGRFGPGVFEFQRLLRALFPWNDRTLFVSSSLMGALAAPIAVAIVKRCRAPALVAAGVVLFTAFSPYHVLVSISGSDHVLSATLVLGALAAWIHGVGRRDPLLLCLALALVVAASLTRLDAWPWLAAVPLWPWLLGEEERGARAPEASRRLAGLTALYGLVWCAIGVLGYLAIALPSHHPYPGAGDLLESAGHFIPQYFLISLTPPFWFSPVATLLSLVGGAWMLKHRPRLLACVVLSLAAAFIPLGRYIRHGDILGARYFIGTIPLFLISSGFGLVVCLSGLQRARAALVSAGGATARPLPFHPPGDSILSLLLVAVIGAATVLLTLPTYRTRYTFQDEYDFLKQHLLQLPDGCTVYQLPMRHRAYEHDLDCCLDAPRSPLLIAFSGLHFSTLDEEGKRPPPPPDRQANGCEAYVESSICSIQPTETTLRRFPRAYSTIRSLCAKVLHDNAFEPLASDRLSNRSTHDLFGNREPSIRLLRWKSPATPRSGAGERAKTE